MSPSDLAEANLLEATREYARWQNDSECVEQNGLLLIAGSTLLAGVRIELFTDETRVRDAVAVNAEAYQTLGLPASEVHVFFGCPHRLLSSRIAGFVAYRDGQPLSTALTVMSAHAAGVYWVGTANAGRRMGLADACTRRVRPPGRHRHSASEQAGRAAVPTPWLSHFRYDQAVPPPGTNLKPTTTREHLAHRFA